MATKPGDFLIGVFDFFAVLVPGAVAASFLTVEAKNYVVGHDKVFGQVPADFWGDTRGWVVFAVGSYLLGQFIYVIGSSLDELYNGYRKFCTAKFWDGRERLSKRAAVKFFRGGWVRNERLFQRADAIMKKELEDSGQKEETEGSGEEVVRTFQWAKMSVMIDHPELAAEINRLEADQKLFRGLMVVLVFVCGLFYFKFGGARPAEWATYVALLVLSFWKYADQRRKTQDLAYTYLMVKKAQAAGAEKPAAGGERG